MGIMKSVFIKIVISFYLGLCLSQGLLASSFLLKKDTALSPLILDDSSHVIKTPLLEFNETVSNNILPSIQKSLKDSKDLFVKKSQDLTLSFLLLSSSQYKEIRSLEKPYLFLFSGLSPPSLS